MKSRRRSESPLDEKVEKRERRGSILFLDAGLEDCAGPRCENGYVEDLQDDCDRMRISWWISGVCALDVVSLDQRCALRS